MFRYRCALALTLILILALATLSAQTSSPPAGAKKDYSQEAAVIEEMTTRIAFENSGNFIREQTSRVQVQTDAGVKQWGLLSFPFEGATETIEVDYVRVRKADGSIIVTPADNMQDLDAEITRSAPFYSDLRERHVAVKGLSIGDLLEYQVHWRSTKPLAPGKFWFGYNFQSQGIVLDERIQIAVPSARAVKVKGPSTTQTVKLEGDSRVYTWTHSRLEDFRIPESDEKTVLDSALGRAPAPDVQVSSFQSWDEVGRWYWDLQKDRIEPSPAIRAKAAELTAGLAADDAKLHALYKFVSTQYRYIGISLGIGRYQPHSADNVLGNSFGDCKDKQTLLAALLQASGFALYPALISSSHAIDPDIPSPAQFDHVIGFLPGKDAKDGVWLDTTPEVAPFGYLLSVLRDKQALVIAGEKSIQLVPTPTDPASPSSEIFNMEGDLDGEGTLNAKMDDTSTGDTEVLVRAAFRRVPQPQWNELVQRISYGLGFAGTVSEVKAGNTEEIAEPFHFSYQYNRKDYPTWKSDHQFVVPGLPFSMPTLRDDAKNPLWLGPSGEMVSNSKVKPPSGYMPILPSNVDLKYDFAEYHASYAVEKGVLISKRRVVSKLREVPASSFGDYRTFVKKVSDDVFRYVQTTSTESGPATSSTSGLPDPRGRFFEEIRGLPDSDSSEANRLETDSRNEMAQRHVREAVSLLQKAVATDPKFTRAWLMLGVFELSDKQFDAGMESFRKAMTLEPTKASIPKALGYSLMAEQKFQEAIPVWTDFIQKFPADGDGPANLASCFRRTHRYAESATALEAAMKLQGDQPALRGMLAFAYLQAGDRTKAAESYRKLGDADKDGIFLNDAAYQMANADIELPLALEYAEKAVRAAKEDSAKISLEELKVQDLNRIFRLAAEWDTLGWVHERMSHLDEAERYLQASWKLTEDGVVAGHLCHLYKRVHKNSAAIQMCRVAAYRIPLSGGIDLSEAQTEIAAAEENLKALTGVEMKPGTRLDESNFVMKERKFPLPRFLPGTESAEFFVLLATDVKSQTFKVEDVKFISGSDKMKLQGKQLKTIDFKVPSPGEGVTRFVRRGILGCYQYSGCAFVLLDPSSVHSIN